MKNIIATLIMGIAIVGAAYILQNKTPQAKPNSDGNARPATEGLCVASRSGGLRSVRVAHAGQLSCEGQAYICVPASKDDRKRSEVLLPFR